MKLNSHNFFENLQGKWISQKNIYFVNSKVQYQYKEIINIINNTNNIDIIKKLLYQYDIFVLSKKNKSNIIYNNLYIYDQNIIKNLNKLIENYTIDLISNNLLKIQLKLNSKDFIYYEYIYYIHPNLRISIGLLKKYNKYVSTTLTSYIKKPIVIK
uniref:Chromophore lyase n=1 Tax=Acrosorium ciliolatum TaxID=1550622 RepID=A0A1Z1M252_9FLOR|nr:hypothetical protein [Acrosorium ciliolatum]ARW59982.1 hypothetical protein [Acrosorium ciliolatum]